MVGQQYPKQEKRKMQPQIFADATFELHKWHSNVAELESTDADQVADQTFAKQQLGTSLRREFTTWPKVG